MSGLIGDAPAQTEEQKAPEQTDVAHRAADPAQGQETNKASADSAAWVEGLSKSLYVDGKPNFEALPEKYWKDGSPDIGSALKARGELEKAFSRGDHKAPTEYDVGFVKEAGVAEDDPLLGSFKSWAKENGVSQDAFKKLASSYIEMQQENAKRFQINLDAEKQKLGPNADKIIGEMVGWGQQMVKKGIWSADDFEEFKVMGGSARGINALMKVREFYGDMQRIPVDAAQVGDQPSRDELNQMVADPRYQKDPAFRSKVEKLFERMYSE